MNKKIHSSIPLTVGDKRQRKRFLHATLVTCVVVALIAATAHVIRLGSLRMDEMRDKATYDLEDMASHIRAAGEDLHLQRRHNANLIETISYDASEVLALLSEEKWQELDSYINIPAGEFTMGTNRRLSDPQNQPQHNVSLDEYWMAKYPVTEAQYARFVATGYRPPLDWKDGKVSDTKLMLPVTMISWFDAIAYCKWDGGHLVTEDEWEKAARGSDDNRRWPWGNQMDIKRLNTYYNVGSLTDVMHYVYGASPYGVMDMSGNAQEWTATEFLPYEGASADADIFVAKMGVARTTVDQAMKVAEMVEVDDTYYVMRGGSWKGDPFSTAVYHRNYSLPNYASDFFGFRCAKSEKEFKDNKSS